MYNGQLPQLHNNKRIIVSQNKIENLDKLIYGCETNVDNSSECKQLKQIQFKKTSTLKLTQLPKKIIHLNKEEIILKKINLQMELRKYQTSEISEVLENKESKSISNIFSKSSSISSEIEDITLFYF